VGEGFGVGDRLKLLISSVTLAKVGPVCTNAVLKLIHTKKIHKKGHGCYQFLLKVSKINTKRYGAEESTMLLAGRRRDCSGDCMVRIFCQVPIASYESDFSLYGESRRKLHSASNSDYLRIALEEPCYLLMLYLWSSQIREQV